MDTLSLGHSCTFLFNSCVSTFHERILSSAPVDSILCWFFWKQVIQPFSIFNLLEVYSLIFHILVIQRRITFRDLLCLYFVLCCCLLFPLVLRITGHPLSPLLSLLSDEFISVPMVLANFNLSYIEVPFSPLAGFLMELPLHSDGLCTLHFPSNFPPV